MTNETKSIAFTLHAMDQDDIRLTGLEMLDRLLQCCTLNLISNVTGISRTTLYKWTDDDVPLEAVSPRDAAWLILVCESDPKLVMILKRGPVQRKTSATWLINNKVEAQK